MSSTRCAVLLLIFAVLSACGGSGGTNAVEDADHEESCDGRADFWVVIQQDYLDQLGDAAAVDFDPPTERVAAANESVGAALVEHAREAETVGCEAEVRPGSTEICGRLDRLQSRGEAGDLVVSQLRARCQS